MDGDVLLSCRPYLYQTDPPRFVIITCLLIYILSDKHLSMLLVVDSIQNHTIFHMHMCLDKNDMSHNNKNQFKN